MKYLAGIVGALWLLVVFLDATSAAPSPPRKRHLGMIPQRMPVPIRFKRLHHRSAMFGEYYPEFPPQMMYVPMTSFSTGDSVSTDFLDQELEQGCKSCDEDKINESPLEESTQKVEIITEEIPQEETAVSVSVATKAPVFEEVTTQKTKTKVSRKPQVEDEDDDDYVWPRSKTPSYNLYFPMMYGFPGGAGRSNHEEGGYPGAATAIANSFSTGKGGVATSHATAFGHPPTFKQSSWKRKSHNED